MSKFDFLQLIDFALTGWDCTIRFKVVAVVMATTLTIP